MESNRMTRWSKEYSLAFSLKSLWKTLEIKSRMLILKRPEGMSVSTSWKAALKASQSLCMAWLSVSKISNWKSNRTRITLTAYKVAVNTSRKKSETWWAKFTISFVKCLQQLPARTSRPNGRRFPERKNEDLRGHRRKGCPARQAARRTQVLDRVSWRSVPGEHEVKDQEWVS